MTDARVSELLTLVDAIFTAGLFRGTLLVAVAGFLCVGFRGCARFRSIIWSLGLGGLVVIPLLSPLAPYHQLRLIEFPVETLLVGLVCLPGRVSGIPLAGWILGAWLVGTLTLLLRLVAILWRGRTLIHRAVSNTEPRLDTMLGEIRKILRVRQTVDLRITADLATPATLGWKRPVILLPREALSWPAPDLQMVLFHEMAHVARNDWIVMIGGEIVRAFYWPNPVVHHGLAALSLAQDQAADEVTLRNGHSGLRLAGRLLLMAQQWRAQNRAAGLQTFARRHTIYRRIRDLLHTTSRNHSTRWWPCALAATALVAIGAGAAIIDPWYCSAARDGKIEFRSPPSNSPAISVSF